MNNEDNEAIESEFIRMKAPHPYAGYTMRRHNGPTEKLSIHRGLTIITVETGDFVAWNMHMSKSYLLENPHLWEPNP